MFSQLVFLNYFNSLENVVMSSVSTLLLVIRSQAHQIKSLYYLSLPDSDSRGIVRSRCGLELDPVTVAQSPRLWVKSDITAPTRPHFSYLFLSSTSTLSESNDHAFRAGKLTSWFGQLLVNITESGSVLNCQRYSTRDAGFRQNFDVLPAAWTQESI